MANSLDHSLRDALGGDAVETDPGTCWPYGYDNSRRHALPAAVVWPTSAAEVQAVIAVCNEYRASVTTRGLGTGTTGAAVPVAGGVVLSTEKLREIRRVDPDNRYALAEAGVTNGELQTAAAKHGLFWPPDPTSAAYSTIGGNLACNAAGPRAVKYGTARENTLGLQAVTGAGELIETGVRTTKGVVGYDLTRLLVGSEGTLAVITAATLRLTPIPEAVQTLRVVYADVAGAARAVTRIMAQPLQPSVLEFMDDAATELVRDKTDLPTAGRALLIIEIDGLRAHLDSAAEAVHAAARGEGLIEFSVAADRAERDDLWSARRALSPALRRLAPEKINEDVVVPVSRTADLIEAVQSIGRKRGVRVVCFGHAGNGNVHVNLIGTAEQRPAMRESLDDLMHAVIELDGTLSGEHGVGLDKREFVPLEIDAPSLALMRAIKRQFDPNQILNPGKIFPLT